MKKLLGLFLKLLGFFLICCLTIGAMIQLTFGRKPIKIKDLHKIEDIPDKNKKLSFSIKQKKIKKSQVNTQSFIHQQTI